jgi:hypothetical protein
MTDKLPERPMLRVVRSRVRPASVHNVWQCPECRGSVLTPMWCEPERGDGMLSGGAMHWGCALCLSRGRITLVLVEGLSPPPLPARD